MMTHSLTLEVPENIYRSLADKASKDGKKIEEIALEKLANGDRRQMEDSSGMDWANTHDEYLGENLMRDMRGESE
jgi:hypothetical protein